jgi:hypothetical protein
MDDMLLTGFYTSKCRHLGFEIPSIEMRTYQFYNFEHFNQVQNFLAHLPMVPNHHQREAYLNVPPEIEQSSHLWIIITGCQLPLSKGAQNHQMNQRI